MLQLTNIFDFPAISNDGSDMGTLDDRTSVARFSRPGPWVPIRLLGKFTGGTSSAPLTIYLDHDPEYSLYNLELKSFASIGTDGTANLIWVPFDYETQAYVVMPPAEVVLVWTNPNTQKWELLLTAADVSAGFGL